MHIVNIYPSIEQPGKVCVMIQNDLEQIVLTVEVERIHSSMRTDWMKEQVLEIEGSGDIDY